MEPPTKTFTGITSDIPEWMLSVLHWAVGRRRYWLNGQEVTKAEFAAATGWPPIPDPLPDPPSPRA